VKKGKKSNPKANCPADAPSAWGRGGGRNLKSHVLGATKRWRGRRKEACERGGGVQMLSVDASRRDGPDLHPRNRLGKRGVKTKIHAKVQKTVLR